MAVPQALLAACAFALGSVLQQKGALETAAGEEDPRFLVEVLRRPVWLAGGGMQAAGWVLQAAALDRGALVIVQALTSLSLVIALPLGAWITSQDISPRIWFGAGGDGGRHHPLPVRGVSPKRVLNTVSIGVVVGVGALIGPEGVLPCRVTEGPLPLLAVRVGLAR